MNNASLVLRSFLVYLVCLPLAVILGFQLANPDWRHSWGAAAVVMFILILPILLRFHHPLLIIAWNSSIVFMPLPGTPPFWLLMALISTTISIGHRTIDHKFRFLSVPELTRPLILMAIIVLGTAEVTGGIGLRSMGSDVYGGRRYIVLVGAIIGYFALTARRIPPARAATYVALFFLAGMTSFIGDFYNIAGPLTRFVYLFFEVNNTGEISGLGATRFLGLTGVSTGIFSFMMARYGINGIFNLRHPWRILFFVGGFVLGLAAVAATPWLFVSGIRGTWWPVRPHEWTVLVTFLLVFAITLIDWSFRL